MSSNAIEHGLYIKPGMKGPKKTSVQSEIIRNTPVKEFKKFMKTGDTRQKREVLCDWFKTNDRFAFRFAEKFGHEDFIVQFIGTCEWAFKWAKHFGKSIKLKRVMATKKGHDSSYWIMRWASEFNEPYHMHMFIDTEQTALQFALNHPSFALKVMDNIQTPEWAYKWMREFPDTAHEVRDIVKESGNDHWINLWNMHVDKDNKITTS